MQKNAKKITKNHADALMRMILVTGDKMLLHVIQEDYGVSELTELYDYEYEEIKDFINER